MFLQPRTVQQVATLPFVPIDGRFEVLLITSRNGGRWLLPKGWPSGERSLAEAARREAEEEAGVVGALHATSIGTYSYTKQMPEGYRVRCSVFVYPMLVLHHRLAWPEKSQRAMRWCRLADAARLVEDRGLARLLAGLAGRDGAALHAAMDAIGGVADGVPANDVIPPISR
jgi:8-oxo-dGTP pyrophosphatase MutT (NUDIX family)